MQGLAAGGVPTQDTAPYFLGCLGKPEQVTILGVDNALIDEEVDIEVVPPTPPEVVGVAAAPEISTDDDES